MNEFSSHLYVTSETRTNYCYVIICYKNIILFCWFVCINQGNEIYSGTDNLLTTSHRSDYVVLLSISILTT